MAKIVLLAIAVWLIISIVKRYRNSVDQASTGKPAAEDMVQCAKCGVHLPQSDSLLIDHQHYCSIEHSKQPK